MKKANKKSKQRTLAGISLVVVVILIAAGTFAYFEYYVDDTSDVKEVEERVIDDRISPLNENQGLVFEVLRIRHRGYYEKFMSRGKAWKSRPNFYYNIKIDDLDFSSKDVAGPGYSQQMLFNDWDTMFQENKIMKDVEEEQATSKIKLTLIERVTTGIIFKKNKDTVKEKIELTYNFRTGRWTGDDEFKDYDGYGHYLGNTFEIWFNIYQIDNDKDQIPYWTEVNLLGTDPRINDGYLDPDKDGIPTDWEWKWGYDPFTWDNHLQLDPDVDGIENHEEYRIAKWLADPFSQDIYLEVDWMEGTGIFDPPHIFYKESQWAIVEKFSEHNIRLYIDDGWPGTPINGGGEELDHIKAVSQDTGEILRWYRNNFPDERKGIFRYMVFGHTGNFNHPAIQNHYDTAFLSYAFEFKQILIGAITKGIINMRTWKGKVASSVMHELGHSIGITPWEFGGVDNYSKVWRDYYSVMNYDVQYNTDLLDYSDGSHGPRDRNDWVEIYWPAFELNANLIEDPLYNPPQMEKILPFETEFGIMDHIHDEEITEKFKKSLKGWSPVDPIEVDWMVFKMEDTEDGIKSIKVFVRPDVAPGQWTLSYEGYIDKNGELQFYSAQDLIDEIMDELKESQ